MKRVLHVLLLAGCAAALCLAETEKQAVPRLVNGRPLRGEVVQVTREGIEVKTPKGSKKTYPWYKLSQGTRYRYQAGYRDLFPSILKGEAAAVSTNTPAK